MGGEGVAKKAVLLVLALLILAGAGWGIWRWYSSSQNRQSQAEALSWTVAVERRDLSETIEATGRVVSPQSGDLYPAYEAIVRQVNRHPGERVRKGEVLMVLDAPSLKEQWVEAEANVNKARLTLIQAQKELERLQKLFEAQGATVDEVESAQKQVDSSREELNLAQFKLNELRAKSDGVNQISADRRYLWICAPFDGEVAWVNVKPGEKVTPQTLLLTLVSHRPLEIEASVDESEIGRVKPGQKVAIFLNDADETRASGVVVRVGKVGKEESGVVLFPIAIQVERAAAKLRPGMSADVTIYLSSTGEVLAIPVNAVIEREGRAMVRLWTPSGLTWTPVQLGVRNGSYVEVVSGLREGDRVVVRRTRTSEGEGPFPPGRPARPEQGGASSSGNRLRDGGMRFGVFGGGH